MSSTDEPVPNEDDTYGVRLETLLNSVALEALAMRPALDIVSGVSGLGLNAYLDVTYSHIKAYWSLGEDGTVSYDARREALIYVAALALRTILDLSIDRPDLEDIMGVAPESREVP